MNQSLPSNPAQQLFPDYLTDNGFADRLRTTQLRVGDRFYTNSQPVHRFYVVRSGLLGVYQWIQPDKQMVVQKISPGEPVGVGYTLQEETFPGELVPIKETIAYCGSRDDIKYLEQRHPGELIEMLSRENERWGDTVSKIDDLISKDLNQRIAQELLDLAGRIGHPTRDGPKIPVKLTRKSISRMMGCAHESVIRVMSHWEQNGWIRTEKKYITIKNVHRLRRIVNGVKGPDRCKVES